MPGYAIFVKGVLIESGEIQLKKNRPIHHRLQQLYDEVQALTPEQPTVLAIEKIRGQMAHVYLTFAAGVIISAGRASILFEIPPLLWRAWAAAQPGGIDKTNEKDAIAIGASLIELARSEHGT
jgi:hypothetical protein